jgi:catechol 2,3-dioxygenase-like lactoylglutathione lyase family enzyme
MVTGFERIAIDVPDLDLAIGDYRRLTGLEGVVPQLPGKGRVAWFGLGNTVVQLQVADCAAARISALAFCADHAGARPGPVENGLQLDLLISDGRDLSLPEGRQLATGDLVVDHLVLRTHEAEDCIALFRDRLGIRLALDRTVPEWGGRMLFFRAGKLTLEAIASEQVTRSAFWGIAYRCMDIEETAARLRDGGVALTDIREGRKPGTRVATVKSHCLDIPTLLIGPAT